MRNVVCAVGPVELSCVLHFKWCFDIGNTEATKTVKMVRQFACFLLFSSVLYPSGDMVGWSLPSIFVIR